MKVIKLFGFILSLIGALSGFAILFSFLRRNPPSIWPLFLLSYLFGIALLYYSYKASDKKYKVIHWGSTFLIGLSSISSIIILLYLIDVIEPKGVIDSNWGLLVLGILGLGGEYSVTDKQNSSS